MADIFFYHLTSTSLEQALPKLLEKALQGGFRTVVRVAQTEQAEKLNNWLWSYTPDSFLPHGTVKDGHSDKQPIYITAEDQNPNSANLLAVTCGITPQDALAYERVLDIFNGEDEQQVADARTRWKAYSNAGHTPTYIRQNTSGSWEKKDL